MYINYIVLQNNKRILKYIYIYIYIRDRHLHLLSILNRNMIYTTMTVVINLLMRINNI